MKRSTMKSDFAMRSRCQSEGRIFPRRKVTSKSHLLNGGIGDFEMELSLAIQESLKYVKQNVEDASQRSTNNISFENSRECATDLDSNDKNTRESHNTSNDVCSDESRNKDVSRMKDLLIAQAELIQCQQEELAQKDEDLKILRSENSNLQCRLQRMERRLSLYNHKEEPRGSTGSVTNTMGYKVESDPCVSNIKGKRTDLKRRNKGLRLTVKKKSKWRLQAAAVAATENEAATESEDDKLSSATDESGSGCDNDSVRADDKDMHSDREEEESKSRVLIDYPILQTEAMYHFYYPKHLNTTLDMSQLHERASHQLEVETPSWRLNPLTNTYQLEGTENITDEAYFKRHQKHEIEEKRRKRWDLQRLRELKIYEKFEEEKESALRDCQDEADVETFLPSIHDLTHIEISSSIPVMAFGQPVPYISPGEFEIPWDMTSSSSSTLTTGRCKYNSSKGSKR